MGRVFSAISAYATKNLLTAAVAAKEKLIARMTAVAYQLP
jgi:hypothetical protein